MKEAFRELEKIFPDLQARGFVDTAPIPEKIVAQQSGLGWIGKNSLLIHRKFGSYLFLAEILTNLDLESTLPEKDHCGTCTRCIDACPTDAILPGKEIDSNLCISYLTIEKRGEFLEEQGKMLDYQIFGCDICQQVCPWNARLIPPESSPFQCDTKWLDVQTQDFAALGHFRYQQLIQKSPLKRAKLAGLQRNAGAILKNQGKT